MVAGCVEPAVNRSRSPDAPVPTGDEPTRGGVLMAERSRGSGNRMAMARLGGSASSARAGSVRGVQITLRLFQDYRSPAGSLWDRFLYGAPLFAPLLFADLAMLAAVGVWGVARTQSTPTGHGDGDASP